MLKKIKVNQTLPLSESPILEMDMSKIIKKRSTPCTFIMNLEGEVIYFNNNARDFISSIIPSEFNEKLREILNVVQGGSLSPLSDNSLPFISTDNGDYYFRSFILNSSNHSQHILVLIEQISQNRKMIDFDYIRRVYGLTHREVEVVGLLLEGLSNKEISQRLYICEYTVKDHLKSIMTKLCVSTRMEVVSTLLHLP